MNYNAFITKMKNQEPECYRGLSYWQRKYLGAMASGLFMHQHHIKPRSSEGETDNSNKNIVSLIPSDHVKAHILLYNEDKTNLKNAQTVIFMSKHLKFLNDLESVKLNKELIDKFYEDLQASKFSDADRLLKIRSQRIKRRSQRNAWDKAHPEVNKKATQKYYENNKEKINEKRRLIYAKNVEKMNEKQRLEYAENKEAKREAAKERMKKYRKKLKEQQQ